MNFRSVKNLNFSYYDNVFDLVDFNMFLRKKIAKYQCTLVEYDEYVVTNNLLAVKREMKFRLVDSEICTLTKFITYV